MRTARSLSCSHACRPSLVAAGVVLAVSCACASAQDAPGQPAALHAPAAGQTPSNTTSPPASGFNRWVDVQTATLMIRYRRIETSDGVVSANQAQDGGAVRLRFKVDPRARFSVNAGIASGNGFTSGWNNMGPGTGAPVNTWFLKQLFLAAAPIAGVEVSYGGLALVRGESTEITSYDNDGYLVGQRVSLNRPKDIFFDEVIATTGFIGRTTRSSVAARLRDLDRVNYVQVLAARRIRKWLRSSADYTRFAGASTFRAAAAVQRPAIRFIDLVRYEQYRRTGAFGAWGFATLAEKKIGSRVTLGAGYADIDANYGGLNADRFNKGRRLYETANARLTRELSAALFMTQATHNAFAVANKRRVDVVLTFNALASLQRAGLLR